MRRIASAAALAVLFASTALVASGWASSSGDVINGCVMNKTGVLRVVSSPGACLKTETAIQWNKTGPVGPAGTDGEDGQDGEDGEDGQDGQDGQDGTSATTTALLVGDANCPTGGVAVDSATPTTYVCNGANGADGLVSFDDLQGSTCRVGHPLAGTIDIDYAAGGVASLTCVSTATNSLTVTRSGSGSGTVTSAPAGIDCPDTCTENFPQTSTVVLTATPDVGHVFAGWTGDCSGLAATCTLAMSSSHTVNAKFRLLHTLTVTIDGEEQCLGNLCLALFGGRVQVLGMPGFTNLGTCVRESVNDPEEPCEFQIDDGASLRLVETPDFDSAFTGWSQDCSGTTATCDLVMDADRDVTASFVIAT